MNERIRELFNIATYESDRLVGGIYHPYIPLQISGEPMRYSITEDGYQKFAESIIEECLHQIVRCTLRNGSSEHNLALYKAMIEIKEHFGVGDEQA